MSSEYPNPFRPFSGGEPLHRAGHDSPVHYLTLALEKIQRGERGESCLLYGPPLFGKTALLRELKRKAFCDEIEVVAFEAARPGPESQNPLNLPEACGNAHQRGLGGEIVSAWEADAQPGAKGGQTTATLQKALGDGPLLFALDDAHNIRFEILEKLFEAARQCVFEDFPLVFLLTSSHSLMAHPGLVGLGPWNHLIGRLDDELIRDALAIPARRVGRRMCPDALDMIVPECEGFPYFAQIMGDAIWDVDPDRQSNHDRVTAEDAAEGLNAARDRMRDFCEKSLDGIRGSSVFKAAKEICRLFEEEEELPSGTVHKIIERSAGETKRACGDTMAELQNFGVIASEGDNFVPGIPRLCRLITERASPAS